MSNQVYLITNPDDIAQDGKRLLFVNLDDTQTQFVSACLNQLEQLPTTIIYVWHSGDDIEWMLDKKHKSSMILFNADIEDDLVVGYLAAQSDSYYLGTLRSLNKANPNAILSEEQLTNILSKYL